MIKRTLFAKSIDGASHSRNRVGETGQGKQEQFVLLHRIEIAEPQPALLLDRLKMLNQATDIFSHVFFKGHDSGA